MCFYGIAKLVVADSSLNSFICTGSVQRVKQTVRILLHCKNTVRSFESVQCNTERHIHRVHCQFDLVRFVCIQFEMSTH